MSEEVVAAGGIVVRVGKLGPEVLIVHRPRYDDWSFPKGKLEPGETPEEAAVREVSEETGTRVGILNFLTEIDYETPNGASKRVLYYAMREAGPTGMSPDQEVDKALWVGAVDALTALTYSLDQALLQQTDLQRLADTSYIYLIRHAAAGSRDEWTADDRVRPITPKGERQSEAIARQLGVRAIDRILSSPYLRCRQTVEPLARRTGLPIEDEASLAEGARVQSLLERLEELAGKNVAICSHGDVIPDLLGALSRREVELGQGDYKKASFWLVEKVSGSPLRGEYFKPPDV